MSEDLSDGQRKDVYISLLRGLTREAQDQLCAEDRQHDWSEWHQTALRKDTGPLRFDPTGNTMNEVVRIKSERHCLNCGKEQFA